MKKLIQIIVFLSFIISHAQKHFKFYLEIPNDNAVPSVSYKENGIVGLASSNESLNKLLSNYTIYRFVKAFPGAQTPSLQNIFILECDSDSLSNYLKQDFSFYFPYIEKIPEEQLFYTPNDYFYAGDPYLNSKNLDLINVKEAWEYSKGDADFLIGISDHPILTTHEDLNGKAYSLDPYYWVDSHGTMSAGTAAAKTDNNLGIAGVGFNSSVLGASTGLDAMWRLYQNGARVINASWGYGCYTNISSIITPTAINEMHANGAVIIASAGNGLYSDCNPDTYYFPASYNHVISVAGVGSQDVGYVAQYGSQAGNESNWRDRIEIRPGYPDTRFQTNSEVDIAAPGFGSMATVIPIAANDYGNYGVYGGTSAAAPHVSGAVSLMFTANACLKPDEVESLLKLTAVKLDSISTNIPYIGKMGAGRMDAGKATKAAWQMNPANGGEVLLKNRTFERWDFELLNSPEYIRLKNEEFIQNANVKFRAKKGITLDTNTLLAPGSGKSHYLYVENTDTCFYFNKSFNPTEIVGKKANSTELSHSNIKLYPNPSRNFINIHTGDNIQRTDIYDMAGKIVKTSYSVKKMNVEDLPKGSYLVKVQLSNNEVETIKFIKN